MQQLPRDAIYPKQAVPWEQPSPSSSHDPGHNAGVQRVPSSTTVPVVSVLTAHGMKKLTLFHGAGWNIQLPGKQGRSPIYQKAGLGQTRRGRCTSSLLPSEANSWYFILGLPSFLANTFETPWHPYTSLFCPTLSSQWDSTLLLPGNPLTPGMEASVGILLCLYGARDGNSLHLIPSPLLSKKLHTEKILN